MIYLDWNATTPARPGVVDAMSPWLSAPANPGSAHRFGREAARAVDEARTRVAALCGWPRDGVVFTGGATEANATVLSQGRWIASAVEHPSVLAYAAATMPVDADGVVRLGPLGGYDGVSVMLAQNETGVVQPIAEVIAAARAAGVLVHVDASQAPGKIALDALAEADFVTLAAHKLGGPRGVGALLVKPGREVRPLLRGGGQERGRRAGTLNVAGIVGFGVAAMQAAPMSPALRDRFEAGARALGGRVAGEGAPRLPNTSNVAFDGVDAPDLVIALDLAGFAISAGSACASGAHESSPVLKAMGFQGSAVRVSTGWATTAAEIDALLAALPPLLERLRGL